MDIQNKIIQLKNFFKEGGSVQEMLESDFHKEAFYDLVTALINSLSTDVLINKLHPIFCLHHSTYENCPNQHSLVDILSGHVAGGALPAGTLMEQEKFFTSQCWGLLGLNISFIDTKKQQHVFISL